MEVRRPPRLASMLLLLAPSEYREYLIGDLLEEYRRNPSAPWYWKQTVRSIPGFLSMRMQRSAWARPAVVATVMTAGLIVAWHAVWTFVLSQVPCKADP